MNERFARPATPTNRDTLATRGTQRLLRIFNYYRIALGIILLALFASMPSREFLAFAPIGLLDGLPPTLYRDAIAAYLVFNILLIPVVGSARIGRTTMTTTMVLVDILLLSALMYSSEAVGAGPANLMVVSVAAGNILVGGRFGLVYAAAASIAIIVETGLLSLQQPVSAQTYLQSGLLGLLMFSVAFLVQYLSRRIEQSEALAKQRAEELAKLEQLSELIIQRMQMGVIASSDNGLIYMMNEAAEDLTGQRLRNPDSPSLLARELLEQLQAWRRNPTMQPQPVRIEATGRMAQAAFRDVGGRGNDITVIYLDDATRLTQQAQQLKLASLGRLTASIAHEIRNPLSAISQASQLMGESESMDATDRKLAGIVHEHCQRVNRIVENVLQLSRRKMAIPEEIRLSRWVHDIVRDFAGDARIEIQIAPADLRIHADPEQMRQVVGNLIDNGLRYSEKASGSRTLRIEGGVDPELGLPTLNIIDQGAGIAEDQRERIFEPFYTTEDHGTGLGLFLSRELCEANHARLECVGVEQGACFRITFARNPQETAA